MSTRIQTQAKAAPNPTFTPVQGGLLQRKCACGGAAGLSGVCEECSKKKRLGLQTKLKVNKPGDIYEQEADRIADQVMPTSVNPTVSGAPPRVPRSLGQSNGQMDAAPASVDEALAGPGTPLEPTLRQDMEQRFGHDFSNVRVHSGAAAEQSAQDVNAHAYTVGQDIVFDAGGFAPGTHDGRRLIAHELTHVVQQAGADRIYADRGNEKRGLSGLSPHVPELVYAAQQGAGNPVGAAQLQRKVRPGGGLSDQMLEQIARQLYKALAEFHLPPFQEGEEAGKRWFQSSREPEIYSALSGRTQAQVDAIARVYKSMYGSELIDDLRAKLSETKMKQLAVLPNKVKVEHTGVVTAPSLFPVPYGAVEVRTGEEIEFQSGTKIPNVMALEYKGLFSGDSKWLQFVWFELTATPNPQTIIRISGSVPTSSGVLPYTTNPNSPVWAVDGEPSDPFYEAGAAAIRTSSSTTIFDDPGAESFTAFVDPVLKMPGLRAEFGASGAPSVTLTAHFETYLIQNDAAAYLVSWQASTTYTHDVSRGTTVPSKVGYTVHASGPQEGLPRDRKTMLDRSYPRFKHVK